jgi:hypothetical protein
LYANDTETDLTSIFLLYENFTEIQWEIIPLALGRPRRRWVDNIKIDLRERGWGGMDWIESAQDRYKWRALVNTVMNLQIP